MIVEKELAVKIAMGVLLVFCLINGYDLYAGIQLSLTVFWAVAQTAALVGAGVAILLLWKTGEHKPRKQP